MLSRANSGVWMEGREEDETACWARNSSTENNKDEVGPLSTFRAMLDVDNEEWYLTNNNIQNHHDLRDLTFSPNFIEAADNNLLLQPMDSSASCSPSSASVFNNQMPLFIPPPKPTVPSLLNQIPNNPLDHNSFNLGCENGFGVLTGFPDLGDPQFSTNYLFGGFGSPGFRGLEEANSNSNTNSLFFNRSKLLKPLENFTTNGAQPTLFQKRAALRKNLGGNLGVLGGEVGEKRKSSSNWEDGENVSMDGSGFNYDSDDFTENNKVEESGKNGGNSSNANSSVTGVDQKGKKKGLPAKNLMAERRRRKKLNDRLYMLRSVVPKISKMDRASILGDAIEYLKELLQKINDLHNELELNPSTSLTPTTSFYPLTPTPPTLPSRIKEELCPSSLPSPTGQPTRVEVRLREGRAVNIHMFCGRRPGLLLSTMRALDNLGLDIQQAVISCFNGFALDIFRAEQCKEGQDVHPDQIKAVLLDSAGFHGMV